MHEDGLSKSTETALLALMVRTGYNIIQENGQRKFGGPPPDWEGPPPPRGCEVFVGKLPRDMYEDELVPLFERAGRIYAFRLMMTFSGENRGYAFVMYATKEAAQRAISLLDNFEIRPGKFIGVCVSLDHCRLFIGSIPKEKMRDDILEEMRRVTDGVVDVIVYPSATDKGKNRGFAFVEYESHKAAALARRKLIPGKYQLWGHTIRVGWADPERDMDNEMMQRVRVLYVRNLMMSTTEETVKSEFSRLKPGAVERVKKMAHYAFVHFFSREDALSALHFMNGKSIDGSIIEVTLAKPVSKTSGRRFSQQSHTGPAGDSFFISSEDESCEVSPARPLSLPTRHSGMCVSDVQRCVYPFCQGINVTPLSIYSLKPSQFCSAVTQLDYFCNKNNWSLPEYYLYSSTSQDGKLLLIFKVVITSVQSSFMPDKLCTVLEDAKELAAQNALWNLDCMFHI